MMKGGKEEGRKEGAPPDAAAIGPLPRSLRQQCCSPSLQSGREESSHIRTSSFPLLF